MGPKLMATDGATPGGGEPVDGGHDLNQVLESFRKRKLFNFASIGAGLLLAILVSAFMVPRYDGIVDLNIHPEGSGALDLGDLADIATGAGGLDWDAKVQTQVLIIQSDPLAWDVVSQLRLDQNPVFMRSGSLDFLGKCKLRVTPAGKSIDTLPPCERYGILRRFSKALEVQALPKTQAVEIRFRSTDAQLAADVANRLTASYLQHNFLTRYQATMQASGWLQDRLKEMKTDVELAGEQLADYQKTANIIGTDESDNLAVSQLSDMGKQLTDAEADRILKEAKYRLAMTGNPELIGTIVPDSVLPTLRGQEAQLNTQLAQAKAEYGSRYPRVVQLQSQVDQVHEALTVEIANIQARFKSEYEAALHTEADLQKSMDRLKQDAFSQSAKFTKYVLLKNEADAKEQLYDDLLKKLDEAGVAAGLKSTNVDVISPADLPIKPALPNIPLFLVVGAAAGLLFGVVGTFVLEQLDHSIRFIGDVEEIVNLPIMGMLPHVAPESLRVDPRTEVTGEARLLRVVIQSPHSEFAEAISALRSALLLASPGAPPKVVMLTSPLPSEGKSLTSVNLAASLALTGRRILLVDADLRRGPRLVSPERKLSGLTGCLSGAATWRDQLQAIPIERGTLMLISAGVRPPNPAELLGSKEMESMIDEWRKEFDFVLIDTPPAAIVTDAIVLSPFADAILLIVRINKTTRFALRQAYSRLAMVSEKVTGVIMNDVEVARQYYGYGSYQKYYSYYHTKD
ncbi:MAG: polysaccharide biosynthesis tyrosine autokinase [Terracidiphilus sp.]|nr:polysaccharide biosynthesis tyrosine autokinase [Terracidiphilus sp.]